MPTVIPKQPKKEREQITIKLDRDVLETLEQYCRYLESSRDYVINQCLVFIFRKDRPFKEWLTGQGLQDQLDYWKRHLAGAPALLELPTDRPRPSARQWMGTFPGLLSSPGPAAGLRERSRRP